MSNLRYEYNEKLKEWCCYDSKANYVVFSGFGKSKEEANTDFFLNQPKVNYSTFNFNVCP